MKKRVLPCLALTGLLLAGCGQTENSTSESSANATAAAPSGLSMVTLGDSISYGYGLDDPETGRYSALLTSMLEQADNRNWNDYNYAVTGDDSTDLIKRLNDGRAIRLPSADVIVLYIGANNLLGVYTDYAAKLAADYEIDPDTMTDEELEAVGEEITADLQDTDAIMQALQEEIDASLVRLETDLETIYTWIRERNADADIYVLNIYNPYRDNAAVSGEEDAEFGAYSQEQIDRCNQIIADFTAAHSELIPVDIAAAFAAEETVPVIGVSGGGEYSDPHPNAEGQQLIADTLYAVMRGET